MEKEPYSRRKFMGKCFSAGSILFGGALLLHSCNSEPSGAEEKKPAAAPPGNPCDDLSGVSAEEIDKRQRMGYVNKTTAPESFCGNCSLYIPKAPDEGNQECGGCLLFKGPVYYDGHCIQWAAKV